MKEISFTPKISQKLELSVLKTCVINVIIKKFQASSILKLQGSRYTSAFFFFIFHFSHFPISFSMTGQRRS